MNTLLNIIDLIYPQRCVICATDLFLKRRNQVPICNSCYDYSENISGKRCIKCSFPLISEIDNCVSCRNKEFYFVNNRSIFQFTGIIKKLIHLYKFSNIKDLSHWFAEKIYIEYVKNNQNLAIIPVPSKPKNIRKRGWGHMEEIGKILKNKYKLNVYNILGKKNSLDQKKLSLIDRAKIIKSNIYIKSKETINEDILLIDDVFTTGSTINACAKTLNENGFGQCFSLTIAID